MARGFERTEAAIQQARRGTVGGNQDQEIQRAVGAILDRYLAKINAQFPSLVEKLEVLNADRQGAQSLAAIRRRDIAALSGLEMHSRQVSQVTADDFNALVADVHEIARTLRLIERSLK